VVADRRGEGVNKGEARHVFWEQGRGGVPGKDIGRLLAEKMRKGECGKRGE